MKSISSSRGICCGLYIVTNAANGKLYIGQTNDFANRIRLHYWSAFIAKKPTPFASALRLHGWSTFSFHFLPVASSKLDYAERLAIECYHARIPDGYNVREGAWKVRVPRSRAKPRKKKKVLPPVLEGYTRGQRLSPSAKRYLREQRQTARKHADK